MEKQASVLQAAFELKLFNHIKLCTFIPGLLLPELQLTLWPVTNRHE